MNINDILIRINKRKKALNAKDHLKNILLLVLPSFLVSILFALSIGLSIYSRFFSFALLSLIILALPMFYTVDYRLRAITYNFDKKDLNYIDGYNRFFLFKQLGLFGVISSALYSLMLVLVFYLIFFRSFSLFCSPFPNSQEAFDKISLAIQNETNNNLIDTITTNLPLLIKPGIVLTSTIFVIPLSLMIFYFLASNLSDHYLATIVLPDIDLNLPAAQSRGLSKASFKRYLRSYFLRLKLRVNWPIYLIFILIYIGLTFIFVSIPYSENLNLFLVPIFICSVPITTLFIGLILNYFCLVNEYLIADEISPMLHTLLPKDIKDSIRSTFKNPEYKHGLETVFRKAFFPDDNAIFNASNLNFSKPNVNKVETYNTYSDQVEVKGGVFDFSSGKGKKESSNKKSSSTKSKKIIKAKIDNNSKNKKAAKAPQKDSSKES